MFGNKKGQNAKVSEKEDSGSRIQGWPTSEKSKHFLGKRTHVAVSPRPAGPGTVPAAPSSPVHRHNGYRPEAMGD